MNKLFFKFSFIIFLLLFSFCKVSNGQNSIELNDSIKHLYKVEYEKAINILHLIKNNEFNSVIKLIDYKVDKKKYIDRFNEINTVLNIYGIPQDSAITFNQLYLKIPAIGDIPEEFFKTVTFYIELPDNNYPEYYNTIQISFDSNKEKDFFDKTHVYNLKDIYFQSAKEHKRLMEIGFPKM